ncbi:uncharacterized protein LOC100162574 isoform X2 [Acyrthosiphon pisum]|uniref:Uncharacterized protein n=1 Tax=Acyrthosiphon pisum TaxID=7029 RepID=A0A8R2JVS0_ACYPI|nr:uncharacterized protein LOC100162574 isoform X2 [Acyrthosiphon pisum]
METAATCKYYVTKLLGISPPKPNCVYDIRSGNVRNREQKSLFRVFYRSNDKRRKQRQRANIQESYVPSMHADEVGAKIGDGRVLEEDTVEDIEKKFQGFRNVFEKCKVKKKKPRLFNVSSGLRFTLVANSMLMDSQKKANETASTAINTEENTIEEDYADEEEEEEEEDNDVEDENDNDGNNYIAGKDIAIAQKEAQIVNDLNEEDFSESKCPKDVADKVNLWIDSSVKQTDGYSEEESLFVDEEDADYYQCVQSCEHSTSRLNSDLSDNDGSTAFALEDQLVRVLEKNTELTIQNTDLHKQVLQLQHVKKGSGLNSVSARADADQEIDEILKLMQDATDKKRALEKDYKECVVQLQDKQRELQTRPSNINYAEKTRLCEHIESLQSKIRELEKKMELENVKQEELQLELEHHKKSTLRTSYKSIDLALNSPSESTTSSVELRSNSINHSSLPASLEHMYSTDHLRQHRLQSAGDVLETININRPSITGRVSTLPSEIDRIMAKIDQDNRVLAELDKTRSTIGLPTAGVLTPSASSIQDPNYALASVPPHMNYPYTELYRVAPGHLTQTYQPLSIGTSVLPTVGPLTTTTPALDTVLLATGQQSRIQPKGRIMPAIPSMINAQQDIDYQNNIINDALGLSMDSTKRIGERRMPDMLDIPGKGQCYVYCARYTYDPFYCSPNENFEEELPITAGDYILVWGNKDEVRSSIIIMF